MSNCIAGHPVYKGRDWKKVLCREATKDQRYRNPDIYK
jgi:hypothetical protein